MLPHRLPISPYLLWEVIEGHRARNRRPRRQTQVQPIGLRSGVTTLAPAKALPTGLTRPRAAASGPAYLPGPKDRLRPPQQAQERRSARSRGFGPAPRSSTLCPSQSWASPGNPLGNPSGNPPAQGREAILPDPPRCNSKNIKSRQRVIICSIKSSNFFASYSSR